MPIAPGLRESDVHRVTAGSDRKRFADVLAVEEPLEIRLGLNANGNFEDRAISITMRTPGDDFSLAAGFLFTEGILSSPDQIKEIKNCARISVPPAEAGVSALGDRNTNATKALPVFSRETGSNTVRVDLQDGLNVDLKRLERNFYITSSCGVCGKSSIEALRTGVKRITEEFRPIPADLIYSLPASLLAAQIAFDKTGGLHASALFDTEGKLDAVCEDVGRHNALDKLIGQKFLAGKMPLSDKILMVSGRASFELVQKALMAGIPILAAVGAPSSLAVELAAEFNMTLIGFVRGDRFNIYSVAERIEMSAQTADAGRAF